jgi:hypothetical protein
VVNRKPIAAPRSSFAETSVRSFAAEASPVRWINVRPFAINAATVRTLVVIEIALMAAGIATAFIEELPPELDRWNTSQDVGFFSVVSIPVSIAMVAAYVGVVRLRPWGRVLYTWVTVAGVLAMLGQDAGVYTRWTGFFSDAAQATSWLLIGLMHFSEARVLFDRKAPPATETT